MTVLLVEDDVGIGRFAEMDRVWKKWFPNNPPARDRARAVKLSGCPPMPQAEKSRRPCRCS